MADFDVISLSSDSSRPSSPFINVSEVFNDSENNNKIPGTNFDETINNFSPSEKIKSSPLKNRIIHDLSESEDSEHESSADISCNLNQIELNRLLEKYSGQKNDNIGKGITVTTGTVVDDSNLNVPSGSKQRSPIDDLVGWFYIYVYVLTLCAQIGS
jgi:DNA segregation ATPase FtsK/SpoIIIE-like protein